MLDAEIGAWDGIGNGAGWNHDFQTKGDKYGKKDNLCHVSRRDMSLVLLFGGG